MASDVFTKSGIFQGSGARSRARRRNEHEGEKFNGVKTTFTAIGKVVK